MKTKHAKSPCCQEKTIKFGNRRRQCTSCKKTWRIRKKKVGRKTRRASSSLFSRYVNKEVPTLYVLSRAKNNQSEDQLKRSLRKSLLQFSRQTKWPEIKKDEKLIAIADAMMITVEKKLHTFYFILLRPVSSNKAVVTKPFIKEGSESHKGWQEAFSKLPSPVSSLICALVCDGHIGLISYAKRNDILLQRCNFHIIAKILGRRSKGPRSRHRKVGQKLYELTCGILTNPSEKDISLSLSKLESIRQSTGSVQLKTYLSGFIKYHDEYRTYLKYPKLNLPRTSNSAEALIGRVRDLCYRAHGFRTLKSLRLWIFAFLKHKKEIKCNPYLPTKFSP